MLRLVLNKDRKLDKGLENREFADAQAAMMELTKKGHQVELQAWWSEPDKIMMPQDAIDRVQGRMLGISFGAGFLFGAIIPAAVYLLKTIT